MKFYCCQVFLIILIFFIYIYMFKQYAEVIKGIAAICLCLLHLKRESFHNGSLSRFWGSILELPFFSRFTDG